MLRILAATWNQDKLKEMRLFFKGSAIDLEGAFEQSGLIQPEETGDTLEANALLKAKSLAEQTGKLCLADDTGLEVGALGGAPGVRSARYAGESVTYAENVEFLLRKMEGIPPPLRKARFRTILAVGPKDGVYHIVEGVLEGVITEETIGTAGFGYDPIFFVPESGKTLAQMDLEEKNRLSHRGRALGAMRNLLVSWG